MIHRRNMYYCEKVNPSPKRGKNKGCVCNSRTMETYNYSSLGKITNGFHIILGT